jgi:putative transcriptional regulator
MKNTIKVQRAIHNLTQAALAEQLNVTRQTVHAMERSKYVPSTTLALKLARLFGIPVEQLFQLEPED